MDSESQGLNIVINTPNNTTTTTLTNNNTNTSNTNTNTANYNSTSFTSDMTIKPKIGKK